MNYKRILIFCIICAMTLSMFVGIFADVTQSNGQMDKLRDTEDQLYAENGSNPFLDISNHWAKQGILELSYMDILKGFPDNTMKPENNVSRAEFIVMVTRALGITNVDGDKPSYQDVKNGQWYYDLVTAAQKNGWLDVFGGNYLYPDKAITRGEIASIVSKITAIMPSAGQSVSFKDIKANDPKKAIFDKVSSLGIITGMPDQTFRQYNLATRAEASVIISRILGLNIPGFQPLDNELTDAVISHETAVITMNSSTVLPVDISMGKENLMDQERIQNAKKIDDSGITYYRSIYNVQTEILSESTYLAQIRVTYNVSMYASDRSSDAYTVTKDLFLKKVQNNWVVYNSMLPFQTAASKINLAWQYIYNQTSNASGIANMEGLNVISPTWFTLTNGQGDIKNLASLEYTKQAHSKGYKVWALVGNNFDPAISAEMLNNSNTRAKVANQLIAYAKDYQLDGLNIDFENMNSQDKNLYTAFVKELHDKAQPLGITISVDVSVIVSNSRWSACFDRKALSEVSDYVALMTYDQHWQGDPESGSVAQLSWVEKNLQTVLKEVPKEKLLVGMPFYTRLWKEQKDAKTGKLIVTSSAISMETAENIIAANNASKIWDAVSGQYYSTYTVGNATYKIWLEDERSIELKTELANKYNLAGVAAWKIGFEKASIWQVISSVLKQNDV